MAFDLERQNRIASLVRQLLLEFQEDPNREGLIDTPIRVAKAWGEILAGYEQSPESVIGDAIFSCSANNMVIVRDIEIYSVCEHHLLPFYGRCHVGYISRNKVLGLSKIARIVDIYAQRLQIQERLTSQVAEAVLSAIDAEGVGVVMECHHMCMMMRGVEKQNSVMTTSSVLGSFMSDSKTRLEFMSLLGKK